MGLIQGPNSWSLGNGYLHHCSAFWYTVTPLRVDPPCIGHWRSRWPPEMPPPQCSSPLTSYPAWGSQCGFPNLLGLVLQAPMKPNPNSSPFVCGVAQWNAGVDLQKPPPFPRIWDSNPIWHWAISLSYFKAWTPPSPPPLSLSDPALGVRGVQPSNQTSVSWDFWRSQGSVPRGSDSVPEWWGPE